MSSSNFTDDDNVDEFDCTRGSSSSVSGSEQEMDSEVDVDGASESECSDLDELYETFEFEDTASQTSAHAQATSIREGTGPSAALAESTDNTPLYPGAQLSTFQSHLLVFQYAIRHSMTTRAFTELLQLLSVHLPRGAAVQKSVHSLKRFFVECFPEAQALEHYYCNCCQRPLPSSEASCMGNGCSGDGHSAVFITIPIAVQLKRMMEGTYLELFVILFIGTGVRKYCAQTHFSN